MPSMAWLSIALLVIAVVEFSEAFVDELPFVRAEHEKIKYLRDMDLSERYELQNRMPTADRIFELFDPELFDLGGNCMKDLLAVYGALKNKSDPFRPTALILLDSSGKPGPGILRGRRNFYGFYRQCLDVEYKGFPDRKFTTNYFGIDFLADFGNATDNPACENIYAIMSLDVCLPNSCSKAEIFELLKYLGNITLPVCQVISIEDLNQKADAGTWITTTFLVLILFLGISASIYDFFWYPEHKSLAYTRTFGIKAWRSFSIYTNIVSIFNTKGHDKPGNIGPLHCMRFFSMFWVILGHSTSLFLANSANPLDTIAITYDWLTQIMCSAFLAVDTFFWQGGLLLSYIWVKKFYQNKRQTNSPFAWIMFYVHRIVRLSPPYYILILFYTFFFNKFIIHNMPVFMHLKADEPCAKNWWIDLLYLNNFIRYKHQCYLVSWYLSTDLQMYLFAPLVLIPFSFNPLFGMASALIILVLSTGANIFTVLHFYFPPTDYNYSPHDHRMNPADFPGKYNMLIYNAPWIRCQIYIIGILTGFLLQMKKTMKIHWAVQIVGWILCCAIAFGCLFSLKDWISGNEILLGWAATFSALSKMGWGLCLSWITILCYYGYARPINAFMSWSFWVPLGKLTYSAYLIHICVVIFFSGNSQQDLIFTNFLQMLFMFVVPSVVTAYFFAIFWSSMFEISFGKLEDTIISALFGAPRRPPAPDAAANAVPPTPKPGDPDMSMGVIPDDKTKPAEAETNGNFGLDTLRKRNGYNPDLPSFSSQQVATIRLTKLEENAWQ